MKKVLIISYFSPPCPLTSANRIEGWLKYLPEYGIKPILITRHWNNSQTTEESRLVNSGDKLEIEKNRQREIHRLPYKANLRDRFFANSSKSIFYIYASKLLTFINAILQSFSIKFNYNKSLYYYAKKYLRNNKDIDTLIISGNPFEQFSFGFLLKKEFPNLKWIADYRDEWTTHHLYKTLGNKNFIIKYLEKKNELKWLQRADEITTVCPYFADRISTFLNKKVVVVPNGYLSDIVENKYTNKSSKIKLVYAGTLFENQDIYPFLNVLDKGAYNNIEVSFVGSKILDKYLDLIKQLKDKNIVKTYDWLPKEEMLTILKEADLFLMFPYKNMKGWPSSKIYDYLPYKKPILLYPSDNDIIEDILTKSSLGIIPQNNDNLIELLKQIDLREYLYSFEKGANIIEFSRNSSTFKLSKLINT